jgi:hypothetical protein
MNELRRCAGRGKRRGDLARDVAAFADAGDDDPPGRCGAQVERCAERAVERTRASSCRPSISARMTRRATARSWALGPGDPLYRSRDSQKAR